MSKYKVLTDGNGSDLIQVVGLGIYVPLSKLQAAQHEAEALAATVEALRSACLDYENMETPNSWGLIFEEIKRCANSNPQQHLRDVRAEAVHDAIHAVANQYDGSDTFSEWCMGANHVLVLFGKYAERVKDGE